MNSEWFNELEALAVELKSLVGYGCKPQHVIVRPVLREVVARKYPGHTNGGLALRIIDELSQAVGTFPDDKAEAFRYLLNLREKDMSALNRRIEAVILLRAGSVDNFRREPELALMRELAKILMD